MFVAWKFDKAVILWAALFQKKLVSELLRALKVPIDFIHVNFCSMLRVPGLCDQSNIIGFKKLQFSVHIYLRARKMCKQPRVHTWCGNYKISCLIARNGASRIPKVSSLFCILVSRDVVLQSSCCTLRIVVRSLSAMACPTSSCFWLSCVCSGRPKIYLLQRMNRIGEWFLEDWSMRSFVQHYFECFSFSLTVDYWQ